MLHIAYQILRIFIFVTFIPSLYRINLGVLYLLETIIIALSIIVIITLKGHKQVNSLMILLPLHILLIPFQLGSVPLFFQTFIYIPLLLYFLMKYKENHLEPESFSNDGTQLSD